MVRGTNGMDLVLDWTQGLIKLFFEFVTECDQQVAFLFSRSRGNSEILRIVSSIWCGLD